MTTQQKPSEVQMKLTTREDQIIIQADNGEATIILGIDEYLKETNNWWD